MSIAFQQNWFHLDRSSNAKDISVFVLRQFRLSDRSSRRLSRNSRLTARPAGPQTGTLYRVVFRPAAGLLRLEPVVPAHRPASRFSAGVNRLRCRLGRTFSRFARSLHDFGPNGHICLPYKRGFFPNGFLGFLSIF
jgi:hypothetical protein